MSVGISVHAGFQVEAVISRGWRTSYDERERDDGALDSPVVEVLVLCRKPKPLVAAVVNLCRAIKSAGKSVMVG